jgi:hypothetical protein
MRQRRQKALETRRWARQRSRVVPPGPPTPPHRGHSPPRTFGSFTKSLTLDHATAGSVDEGVTGSIPVGPHHPVLRNRKSGRRLAIGRFCGDFGRVSFPSFGPGEPYGLSGQFLASRLCIQKFRSPRQVLKADYGRLREFWESWGAKSASYRARSVIIAGSIRAPRIVGSIRLAHRATVRLRCLAAAGLRSLL